MNILYIFQYSSNISTLQGRFDQMLRRGVSTKGAKSRRSRGNGGRYSLHLAAMGPDGGDVVAVEHIEGPLKALPDRQGADRLREVPVVHHDGVEGLAHGEASPPPKYRCPAVVPR